MSGLVLWMVAAVAATVAVPGYVEARAETCQVMARTDAGWVCGLQRFADDGSTYASFRGVPYGKPPTGKRRFQELEPTEHWDGFYDASTEGAICLQTDVLYGSIMQPRGQSEDCIFVNIHVPSDALPNASSRQARELTPPRQTAQEMEDRSEEEVPSPGLPIFVFIHGGGFAFGSGDSDLHGPEYLVSKNVIVITFNYRTNVFGFLNLNIPQAPSNAGLRDMVTLLHWVQRNGRNFGGDPDNVTIAGQSAGAVSAHLLTLSKATQGLFKRAISMSGTAISPFVSPSPVFAQYTQQKLLEFLKINSTKPEEILQELIELPADMIVNANQFVIDHMGLTTFVPTVETSFPGVTAILDDYPEALLAQGRGKDIPLIIGYTDAECETFRARLTEFDIVKQSKNNPLIIIPPRILFSTPPELLRTVMTNYLVNYYNGTFSTDGFLKVCTDGFFEYPVIKFVEEYGKTRTAPTYVYKFTYEGDSNVIKNLAGNYRGAAHIEDLTYIFKTNSAGRILKDQSVTKEDKNMKNFMTNFFVNFMTCSKPICDVSDAIWPGATRDEFRYENIHKPFVYQDEGITAKQQDIKTFYATLTTTE